MLPRSEDSLFQKASELVHTGHWPWAPGLLLANLFLSQMRQCNRGASLATCLRKLAVCLTRPLNEVHGLGVLSGLRDPLGLMMESMMSPMVLLGF